MEFLEWDLIFKVAEGFQEAVSQKNWTFLAVVLIFVVIQLGKKSNHVKKNAPQYSAGLGGLLGGAMGDDPAQGALNGVLIGNAASGLYSLLKPLLQRNYLIALLGLFQGYKAYRDRKKEKILDDFDEAMDTATDEDNPNTEDLEDWYKENL